MQEYKKETTSGEITTWLRAKQIIIENTLNGIPTVTFNQETIKQLPDNTMVISPEGSLNFQIKDADESFELLNPMDGTVIGEMTYGQVMAAIYSIYVKQSDLRG